MKRLERCRRYTSSSRPTFHQDFETYMKDLNICLVLKIVCHKSYKDLQFLPVFIYRYKELSMGFVSCLLLLVDRQSCNYNLITVAIVCLIKIMYYKPVKTTIDEIGLIEAIINVVIRQYGPLESTINH